MSQVLCKDIVDQVLSFARVQDMGALRGASRGMCDFVERSVSHHVEEHKSGDTAQMLHRGRMHFRNWVQFHQDMFTCEECEGVERYDALAKDYGFQLTKFCRNCVNMRECKHKL